MSSFINHTFTLFALLVVLFASSTSAFNVAKSSKGATSSVVLNMGLFDAFQPKPPVKKGGPKQDANVFAGRAKKITIRQDEDNAMWIEEPKKKDTKKKGK